MNPLWDGILEGTDVKKQRKGCEEAERNLGDSSRNKRVSQQVLRKLVSAAGKAPGYPQPAGWRTWDGVQVTSMQRTLCSEM